MMPLLKAILRLFCAVSISCMIATTSCSSIPIKTHPEYTGVDPKFYSIYNEFMWLSIQNNIQFYNKVTVGFKKIKSNNIIGICTYGPTWREIDVDVNYWNHSTYTSKTTLLFHELTHCFCGRKHDYSEGKYSDDINERLKEAFDWLSKGGKKPGRWDDGCPVSLMYPVVLDDDCMKTHYSEYVKEMFDRCSAW